MGVTGSDPEVAEVEQAHRLTQFFRSSLKRWTDFYEGKDLYSVLYRERRIAAIQLVEDLNLPAGALTLDVGCGPGILTVALARKQYVVYATDLLREMAAATRTLSRNAGLQSKVIPTAGDACHLPFIAGVFDVVVLIGITEWVPVFPILHEATRVLKPGGHLVVSWDNRWGLQFLVDPLSNPLLQPLRRRVRTLLERRGSISPQPCGYTYSMPIFDAFLRACGLLRLRAKMVGFGPFSLLGQPILSEHAGQRLNAALQKLANAQTPVLRSSGRGYVALAQKVARN